MRGKLSPLLDAGLSFRPSAWNDIAEQRDYYAVELDEPELGQRFVCAVKETCELITRAPHGYPQVRHLRKHHGVRFRPVKDFPNHLVPTATIFSSRSAWTS